MPLVPGVDKTNVLLLNSYFLKLQNIYNFYVTQTSIYFLLITAVVVLMWYAHTKIIIKNVRPSQLESVEMSIFYIYVLLLITIQLLFNLFINYEISLCYGHIHINPITYKLMSFLMHINMLFIFIIQVRIEMKKNYIYHFIYMTFLTICTPIIYSINTTLGFFYFIEILSLLFLLFLIIQLHTNNNLYQTDLNGVVNNKILFKKTIFTLNTYFWALSLISLIFYLWYYYYVFNTTQFNWFAVSNMLNLISADNHYLIFNCDFNFFFLIFLFIKGGWIPFFIWKIAFIKYCDTNMLFVYIIFYYFVIYTYIHFLINFYLYYLFIKHIKVLLTFLFLFYAFVGYINYKITSLNFFILISSLLNSFVILSIMFIFYITNYNTISLFF